MAVQLTHKAKTYHPGDKVNFTYKVDNLGPATARDAVLTNTLPQGLSFDSIVASNTEGPSTFDHVANLFFVPLPASAAPNTPFNCSSSDQQITCTTPALAVGTYTLHMVATIQSGFTAGDRSSDIICHRSFRLASFYVAAKANLTIVNIILPSS